MMGARVVAPVEIAESGGAWGAGFARSQDSASAAESPRTGTSVPAVVAATAALAEHQLAQVRSRPSHLERRAHQVRGLERPLERGQVACPRQLDEVGLRQGCGEGA